jgi:hypothetical protein
MGCDDHGSNARPAGCGKLMIIKLGGQWLLFGVEFVCLAVPKTFLPNRLCDESSPGSEKFRIRGRDLVGDSHSEFFCPLPS